MFEEIRSESLHHSLSRPSDREKLEGKNSNAKENLNTCLIIEQKTFKPWKVCVNMRPNYAVLLHK